MSSAASCGADAEEGENTARIHTELPVPGVIWGVSRRVSAHPGDHPHLLGPVQNTVQCGQCRSPHRGLLLDSISVWAHLTGCPTSRQAFLLPCSGLTRGSHQDLFPLRLHSCVTFGWSRLTVHVRVIVCPDAITRSKAAPHPVVCPYVHLMRVLMLHLIVIQYVKSELMLPQLSICLNLSINPGHAYNVCRAVCFESRCMNACSLNYLGNACRHGHSVAVSIGGRGTTSWLGGRCQVRHCQCLTGHPSNVFARS